MNYQHNDKLVPNTEKHLKGEFVPPVQRNCAHCHSSVSPRILAHSHMELDHSYILPVPSLCSSKNTGKAV